MERMHMHEVALREKLQQSVFKTGTVAAEAGKVAGTDAGAIRKLLQEIFAVNSETVSKVVDENGEPMAVHHGSAETGIEAFDAAKAGTILRSDWGEGIYFTPARWMADSYRDQPHSRAIGA